MSSILPFESAVLLKQNAHELRKFVTHENHSIYLPLSDPLHDLQLRKG